MICLWEIIDIWILDSLEFRIIVTCRLWKERNRISTEEYFWSPDTLHVKCVARCVQDDGLLVLVTVEKDLGCVTGLSYIQTAFRPRDSESTRRWSSVGLSL